MHALDSIPSGYTSITVDLEEHHTLEQIVAEIIDQVRRGDSLIPPFVASGGIPDNADDADKYAKRAADRVVFALRRSRYALSISGIDAFPFQPTTHHGVTREYHLNDELQTQYKLLFIFLKHLAEKLDPTRAPKGSSAGKGSSVEWTRGDSYLMLAYERPYTRHLLRVEQKKSGSSKSEYDSLTLVKSLIEKYLGGQKRSAGNKATPLIPVDEPIRTVAPPVRQIDDPEVPFFLPGEFRDPGYANPKNSKHFSVWQAVTAALACHRRTRTHVGISQLLRDLFAKGPKNCPKGEQQCEDSKRQQ